MNVERSALRDRPSSASPSSSSGGRSTDRLQPREMKRCSSAAPPEGALFHPSASRVRVIAAASIQDPSWRAEMTCDGKTHRDIKRHTVHSFCRCAGRCGLQAAFTTQHNATQHNLVLCVLRFSHQSRKKLSVETVKREVKLVHES